MKSLTMISRSYALGLLFIVLVAVIWAASSVMVQFLYTDKSFHSPFLLTYIGVSLFTLWLPAQCLTAAVRESVATVTTGRGSRRIIQGDAAETAAARENRCCFPRWPSCFSYYLLGCPRKVPFQTLQRSRGNSPRVVGGFELMDGLPSGNRSRANSVGGPGSHFESENDDNHQRRLTAAENGPTDEDEDAIVVSISSDPSEASKQGLIRRNHSTDSGDNSIDNIRNASNHSGNRMTSLQQQQQQPQQHHGEDSEQGEELDGSTNSRTSLMLQEARRTQQQGDRSSQSVGSVHEEELQTREDYHHDHPHWTHGDHFNAALRIAPVWFAANWTYNASLAYTSITSSTVLASTGSLFTFLFAVTAHDERFTWAKLSGVLLGVTGSVLTALHDASSGSGDGDDGGAVVPANQTSYNDTNSTMFFAEAYADNSSSSSSSAAAGTNPVLGDALGLISAVGYGAYAVQTRLLCPHDESLYSMQLLLGYIGLINMLVLSPLAIGLSWGMHEHPDEQQLTVMVLGCLIIKGLLDNVLSDYLWLRAVILTNATVATVGLGLTIPLAFVSDVLLAASPSTQSGSDTVLSVGSVVGAVAVLAGFVMVNIGQQQDENSDNGNGIGIGSPDVVQTGEVLQLEAQDNEGQGDFDGNGPSDESTALHSNCEHITVG